MTEEKEKFLKDRINQCSFNMANGIHAIQVSEGYAEIEVEISTNSVNIWGAPHGGVLFAAADVAAGLAAQSLYDGKVVTASANVNFIRADLSGNNLRGIGRAIKRGRTIGFFNVEVYSGKDDLLLTGQFIMHCSK